LSESVSAGQGWIVFLVVGFLTGILAGMIQIAREWAFDLKFGYCQTGMLEARNLATVGMRSCPFMGT